MATKTITVLDFIHIPDPLGITSYITMIFLGIFEAFQGNVYGGLISGAMSIMGGIYMWKKIQGQHLDNEKKKLSSVI
jgi:hypothetical protein